MSEKEVFKEINNKDFSSKILNLLIKIREEIASYGINKPTFSSENELVIFMENDKNSSPRHFIVIQGFSSNYILIKYWKVQRKIEIEKATKKFEFNYIENSLIYVPDVEKFVEGIVYQLKHMDLNDY